MKRIIGGIITLIIGGTIFAVSESDIARYFSKNTGMTQEQAEEYINGIPGDQLDSFSVIGEGLIDDGNSIINIASDIDCYNYSYEWETFSLSCQDGKNQMQKIGNDEIALGNCYKSLDTDLGDSVRSKMSECISGIDEVNSDYSFPIVSVMMDNGAVSELRNTNLYNKSLLEASLDSE